MNGSNVWGSLELRVQMEYSQKNEYFPFKTVIIDDFLQNTLGILQNQNTQNQNTLGIFTYLYSHYS